LASNHYRIDKLLLVLFKNGAIRERSSVLWRRELNKELNKDCTLALTNAY